MQLHRVTLRGQLAADLEKAGRDLAAQYEGQIESLRWVSAIHSEGREKGRAVRLGVMGDQSDKPSIISRSVTLCS